MPDRHPLKRVARKWATVMASVSGVVTALATGGLLTVAQAEAVDAAFTAGDAAAAAIVGLIAAGAAAISAFRTAGEGEASVTPTADPRDPAGRPLVAEPGPINRSL